MYVYLSWELPLLAAVWCILGVNPHGNQRCDCSLGRHTLPSLNLASTVKHSNEDAMAWSLAQVSNPGFQVGLYTLKLAWYVYFSCNNDCSADIFRSKELHSTLHTWLQKPHKEVWGISCSMHNTTMLQEEAFLSLCSRLKGLCTLDKSFWFWSGWAER